MKEGSTAVAKWTDHMYKTTEWMCKVKEGVDIRRRRIMLAGREREDESAAGAENKVRPANRVDGMK